MTASTSVNASDPAYVIAEIRVLTLIFMVKKARMYTRYCLCLLIGVLEWFWGLFCTKFKLLTGKSYSFVVVSSLISSSLFKACGW